MALSEVFNEEVAFLVSSPHHTLRMKQARQCYAQLLESTRVRLYLFHRFCSYKTLFQRKAFEKDLKISFLNIFLLSSLNCSFDFDFAIFERFTRNQHTM